MFSVYILPYLRGLREKKGLSYSYNSYFRMTSRRQRTDRQRRARKDARMNKYRQNARDEPARDPEDDEADGARRRCSRRKCIPIIILIVAMIAGGITVSFVVFTGKANADATVSTDSETCSDEWSEWTVVNECADRGSGTFEENVKRTRYDSTVCIGQGQSVKEETMNRDCDTSTNGSGSSANGSGSSANGSGSSANGSGSSGNDGDPTTTCSNEWSEWTLVNACADHGPGPFKEQVRRTRYDSAVCAGEGKSVEEETMYRECGEEKDMSIRISGWPYEWRGTDVNWGFGKFNR